MRPRKSQTIKEWPEADRPREKLIAKGPEALSEAELLAIILRTGDASSSQSAVDQARNIIKQIGDLNEIEAAGISEICKIAGVGPAKAATLKAALEIGRRLSAKPKEKGSSFTSSGDVFHHFKGRLDKKQKETFIALLLDSKHHLIKEVMISEGSLTGSPVHPREVFKPAIRESAAAVIFAHNHPSGDPSPSKDDMALTRRLVEVGDLVGVKVLDHVIIGHDRFTSLADEGNMQPLSLVAEKGTGKSKG